MFVRLQLGITVLIVTLVVRLLAIDDRVRSRLCLVDSALGSFDRSRRSRQVERQLVGRWTFRGMFVQKMILESDLRLETDRTMLTFLLETTAIVEFDVSFPFSRSRVLEPDLNDSFSQFDFARDLLEHFPRRIRFFGIFHHQVVLLLGKNCRSVSFLVARRVIDELALLVGRIDARLAVCVGLVPRGFVVVVVVVDELFVFVVFVVVVVVVVIFVGRTGVRVRRSFVSFSFVRGRAVHAVLNIRFDKQKKTLDKRQRTKIVDG